MTKSRPALSVKRKRMEEMLACATKQYEDLVGANERLQTRLTAVLAEAEAAKELSEGRLKELLRVADKYRDLDRANMNLEVETAALHADQLLQANTLKALREELKLAKKDATDWALNHEKEKRRADETETKLEGARLIIIFLAVVALGAAGCMIFLEVAR